MAGIQSINDLALGQNATYVMNFNSTPNRGFVTSDNSILAPLWYCKVKMAFHTNWNWGFSEYDNSAGRYLANNKFFRLWNPGETKENCYLEFSARSANGEFKWACEDSNGNNRSTQYAGQDLKNVLKAGTTHVLEYEFKENSHMKVWLNGNLVGSFSGFTSKSTPDEKRVYCLGLENEWNSGSKYGDNVLTLSDIVLAENKTRDQYIAGSGGQIPTPTPTPTPSYALKSDFDALKAQFDALRGHLKGVP